MTHPSSIKDMRYEVIRWQLLTSGAEFNFPPCYPKGAHLWHHRWWTSNCSPTNVQKMICIPGCLLQSSHASTLWSSCAWITCTFRSVCTNCTDVLCGKKDSASPCRCKKNPWISFTNFCPDLYKNKSFNLFFQHLSTGCTKNKLAKLGRHALHRVRSVWKSLGSESFGSFFSSENTL